MGRANCTGLFDVSLCYEGSKHTSDVGELACPRSLRYHAVRIVLSAVLLFAGVMKAGQLLTAEFGGETSAAFELSVFLVAVAEIILGLWLLTGIFPRQAWLISLIAFSIFESVSLYYVVSSEKGCGCFGSVEVSPWYTFAFDVLALVAIVCCPPPSSRRTFVDSKASEFPICRRHLTQVIGQLVVLAIIVLAAIRLLPNDTTGRGNVHFADAGQKHETADLDGVLAEILHLNG